MESSKISELLDKINKAVANPAFPAISKLEQDLLLQHLRSMYDEIDSIKAIGGNLHKEHVMAEKKEAVSITTPPVKKPVFNANENLLVNEEAPVHKAAERVKRAEAVVTIEEKVAVDKAEVIVEPKVEKKVQSTSSSINENIKAGGSLNEKLKVTTTTEIHKKLATKPLKELIDLNKKFVLLNELFKGNTEAYTSAITHIDTLPDYDTAQSFITTQLVANYFWDESKQSTRMFTKLVKMKFGVE